MTAIHVAAKARRVVQAVGTLALVAATAAQAQQASPSSADTTSAEAPSDDVIVTARRTREALQTVPMSISALSADQLADAGVSTFADTIALVPNVAMGGGIAGVLQGQLGIRGISTLVRNPGVEAGVGIYVDGVYMGRSDNYNQELIDTAQVEVLRGPQGTLFGKNTIAGVFNITTQRPDGETKGEARLEVGNYDLVRAQGYVMGPVAGEAVQAKLSLGYVNRDGVYRHLSGGQNGDALDLFSYRGTLYLQAGERTTIDLTADGLRDRGHPAFFQAVDIAGVDLPTERMPLTIDNNKPDALRRDNYGFSGTINVDAGDATITSITAYRRSKFTALLDDDQSQLDIAGIDRWSDTTRLFTQEVRAAGEAGAALKYVGGVFYSYQKVTTDRIFGLGADTGLAGLPSILTNGSVTARSYAAFANLTWQVASRVSLDGGLRLTKEDKSARFTQSDTLGLGPIVGLPPLSYARSTSDTDLSPTLTLSYQVAPRAMVYGRFARGFKSASFNIDLVPSTNGLFAGPENATTYELGLKSDLLGRTLRLNLAGFVTNYNDMQVSQLLGSGVTLDNAGKATIKGVEAELVLTPVRPLRLSASTGYLDARYDRYANCGIPASLGGGTQASCAGNRIVGAPDWTYHADAQYTVPLGGADLIARLSYSGQTKVYYEATNSERFSGGARDLLDARFGLQTPRWDAFAWVRNLTDERYVTYADDRSAIGVRKTAAYGEPRTFGATFALHL